VSKSFPNAGSSKADIVDFAIQQKWDHFAMADDAIGPESQPSQLSVESRESTNVAPTLEAL